MSVCQAVIAEFTWGSQTCQEPAAGFVTTDDGTFPACDEHLGAK